MAININHPKNSIQSTDKVTIESNNNEDIELKPDSGLVNVDGDINIRGNFTVQGTVTTINSTTSTLVDPIVLLGTDEDGLPTTTNDNKDRGIAYFYNDGTENKTGFFGFDRSNNDFRFIPDAEITGEIVSGDNGTITIGRVNAGDLTIEDNHIASANSTIDVSGNLVTNLAEPVNPSDAVRKDYVDSDVNEINSNVSQLNSILSKLVPPAPPAFPGEQNFSISGLSSYRMADFVQTDNTSTGGKSVAGGTVVNSIRRAGTYSTNEIVNVGPGDSGTLTLYKNGSALGQRLLTTASNNGTYSDLAIANNVDYGTISGDPTGFWKSFNCSAAGSAVAGWNDIYVQHSAAGSTTPVSWYYDASNPGTPEFGVPNFIPNNESLIYSSTIPHYTDQSDFSLSFTVNKLSGDTYPTSDNFVTGTAGGSFLAPISVTYGQAGITTPLPRNLYVSSGNHTVETTAKIKSGFGSSSLGPAIAVTNGYASASLNFSPNATVLYKTGTSNAVEESNIKFNSPIGSGTTPAYRIINPGSTDTPAHTTGAGMFNSETSVLETYDATVVAGVIKHDITDYSRNHWPVGPNLSSGRSSPQYFTFKFIRESVSKFNIRLTGTVAGLWVSVPGSGLDNSSTLSGWLDMSTPYAGAGRPGAGPTGNGSNGCALGGPIMINTTINNRSYTCTFGIESSSISPTNEIYVRIKLTNGQAISALSLETASN